MCTPSADVDRAPAHALWVELSTRVATQRLHFRSGDEETAAASVYILFGKTRELMQGNSEAKAFQSLALALLNNTLRPNTARWQGWMTEDHTARDENGKPLLKFRDEWVRRQFRRELRALQPWLMGFMKAFEAMKDGWMPEDWWTSPDKCQLEDLRKECLDAGRVKLGRPLSPGIRDHVRFGDMAEEKRRKLCEQINQAEQAELRKRRIDGNEELADAMGLAFSGGGIRSATFCLGITEVLARRGLLSQFDYLSTVSGGGYFGAFLSAYLGTGGRLTEPSKPDEFEAKARIRSTFVPGEDQREPSALRHLRNRSRYLVDGGFVRKSFEIGLVVAGILFNLLIVLPVPLLAALLVVPLYHSHVLGMYDWTLDPKRWLPPLDAPWSVFLSWLLGLFAIFLLAYPYLKARSLKSSRNAQDWALACWWKVFPWLTGATIAFLLCWLTPLGFRLYHWFRTGAFIPWFGDLKIHLDQLLTIFGLTLITLLGAVASRVKNNRRIRGMLGHLAILGVPLLCLLVFCGTAYRMLFVDEAQQWEWGWVALATGVMVGVAWRFFDVNTYSPHGYYRDRLSECYLRARKRKVPDEDEQVDRLRLSELNDFTAAPYHLINATVNLPSSSLREIRGRNGDFYLFSKHFCGSPMCGYYPTKELEEADPHFNLGTAMAISGAAASSNMGWQTNNSVRMLMTLANVRLGYWLRNPWLGIEKTQNMRGPGPLFLFREMFASHMDERRHFLNLSDGGHIENLAVYELLRRRCKFIVCVDGGMEPDMECTDLIRLERYAAIDLGIKMHYDLTDLMLQPNGYSRAYGVLVKIDYEPPQTESRRRARDPSNAEWGWMLYIKLAMIGYGPGYVMDYKRQNPAFPHQSTRDQIYDEAQFEAYRALGEAAAESFFTEDEDARDIKINEWFIALATSLLPDNDEAFRAMAPDGAETRRRQEGVE